MDRAKSEKEIEEARALLKQCDNYIANYDTLKKESEADVREAKKELEEAKAALTEAKRNFATTMKEAENKHYSAGQRENLSNVHSSGIENATAWVKESEEDYKKQLEYQRNFTPELLAEAKAERPTLYARVKELESQLGMSQSKGSNSSGSEKKYTWVGFIVIIVIIVLIVKACSK